MFCLLKLCTFLQKNQVYLWYTPKITKKTAVKFDQISLQETPEKNFEKLQIYKDKEKVTPILVQKWFLQFFSILK